MKTLSKVSLFYVVTFVFTIILAIPLMRGIESATFLVQLALGFAALMMLVIFRKDKVKLTINFTGAQIGQYIAALAIPFLVWLVIFFIYRQFIGLIYINIQNLGGFAIVGALLGSFGEELGWRGYLQMILEKKQSVFVASLLVGLLWGLWHIGNFEMGLGYVLFFIGYTTGISMFMAWLLRDTGYNVVIAWLFHFSLNVGNYLLGWDVIMDVRYITVVGIVWVIAAVSLVVLKRTFFLNVQPQVETVVTS